jgi:hypothetical protein
MVVILAAIVLIALWGGGGAYVAGQKYRSPAEGFWLALLFGPFGLIVEACLPTGDAPLPRMDPPRREPRQQPLEEPADVVDHLAEMQKRLTRPLARGNDQVDRPMPPAVKRETDREAAERRAREGRSK